MNKLIFADNSELEILTIIGGRQYIQNAMRDVLTIEVAPEKAEISQLREMFQNKGKTQKLTVINRDGDGNEIVNELGSDYTLYLSVANEIREIPGEPGVVQAPQTVEVNIVKIAQITYLEKLLEMALGAR